MKIINQSYEILNKNELENATGTIEAIARICYKSEDRIKEGSDIELCNKLLKRGHEAMIEHGPNISVKFITDRGVSHEIVRHRMASFAQESTRYVSYKNSSMEFIRPAFKWASHFKKHPYFDPEDESMINDKIKLWVHSMCNAETAYKEMIKSGCSLQEARSVLPNSLKTEIVVTANIREWRHIFKLRTAKSAHPQIRELMKPLLKELQSIVPVLFKDITVD